MAIVDVLEPATTSPTATARKRLSLRNPATLEPLGEVEVATREDVVLALSRARKAQPLWAEQSFEARARVMQRAVRILLDRQNEYIDVILSESGKPRTDALQEIFGGCDALTYYAKRAGKILRAEKKRPHGLLGFMKKLTIVYKPLGVVGIITPWNGPFALSINPTVQALMAGNAVLLKPSEVTPRSGRLIGDLFEAAGLPDGLLHVLLGDGETGAALVESGVDKISFTGSVATGRRVAVACAERLTPCTLELGGKDPMIVCADADLDNAAAGAVAGAMWNTGQYCCGTERVYVVESVADDFTRKVVERVKSLRQSAGGEHDVGAIFQSQQLEIISQHVDDAVAKGAVVQTGGRRNPELAGLYYEPTVLTDVRHDMKIMRDETFGPVLPIMRVRDEAQALELANDSRYGLGANVWSRDTKRAFELSRRIESGSVCINDMMMTYGVSEAPFGGVKDSGLGQVNGEVGLKSYCWAQPIISDKGGGKQTASRYPYSDKKDAGMQKFMRLLFGTPLGRWLS